MKVKLKVGKVINGAVWAEGSEIDEKTASVDELKKLVKNGDAELLRNEPPAPFAPSEEKKK